MATCDAETLYDENNVNISELQSKTHELNKENEELKKQLLQNSQGVESLLAQLDAHRGMLNEHMTYGLQMRTNIVLLQKENKRLNEQLTALSK